MNEKLCLFCKNFQMMGGCADTYGYGGEDYMTCAKGKASFNVSAGDEDDFRKSMQIAAVCPDYKQVPA